MIKIEGRNGYNVLNHGHVALVESMGSDLSIVRNARVSYDADWRAGEDEGKDKKLIHYLVKNGHTSPFESVQFTFDVKAPIFVFRQWHRHRTWCLSGNSEITFEIPCRYKQGKRAAKTMKLKELYDKWNTDVPVKNIKRRKKLSLMESNRNRIKNMMLRVYDESKEEFVVGHIEDIIYSGKKQVYKVTLQNGKSIVCSMDHRLLTYDGWKTLKECNYGTELLCNGTYHTEEGIAAIRAARSGPKSNFWKGGVTPERKNIARWIREHASLVHKKFNYTCQHCGVVGVHLHAHHIKPVVDFPELGKDINNLISLCENCHHKTHGRHGDKKLMMGHGQKLMAKPSKIKRIELVGEECTYDISVSGEHHNFIANGIIVHNSYNEISARYSELPDEFYIPELDRITTQADGNKQMSSDSINRHNKDIQYCIEVQSAAAFAQYDNLLKLNCPREIARTVLPVGTYSHMFASVSLLNLMRFCKLRSHPHAQYEIKVYSDALMKIAESVVPVSISAFREYWL